MIQHLAAIMDGNRRWARRQGFKPWVGHRNGAESVKTLTQFCLKKNIPYLSLYAFSLENFKRSQEELSYLFSLITQEFHNQLDQFINNGIKVRFIGDRTLFPAQVVPTIIDIEEKTAHLSMLNLNFLFCYGSRQEIIGGIQSLIKKIKAGIIAEHDISDETFSQCLWTADIPEPELIIRTGGMKRLSNFLLYQAAYSEFYFLDCLWPEITEQHLNEVLDNFQSCQRNYGV